MNIQNDQKLQNDLNMVFEKIQEIVEKSSDGDYIYRGEPECHQEPPHCGKVSSSLWRKYFSDVGPFNIEVVQNEMLNDAKRHIGHLPQDSRTTSVDSNMAESDTDKTTDFETLAEIQHYDGKTNLIDFTTDYLIALFFACDGDHDKDGRIILQKAEAIKDMIKHPRNPRHRVVAQKSVFVRPPKGFIEPHENDIVIIPADLKQLMLEHLRTYHGISTETIYNDLHGFIRNQDIHGGAYTQFYKGLACQNRGDQNTISEEKQKEYEESIEHYTKAIDIKPDFANAYNNRGNAYGDKGDYDRAIEDYTKAIQFNPNYAEAYNNRGNAYGDKGDYDRAIEDYTKAIQHNPNDAETYNNRGIAYRNKGDNDRAIEDYTKAIQLNSNDAEAYNNRGNAYGDKGDYDRAIEDYNEAIQRNPNDDAAYNNRGNAYRNKGDNDRAIEDYTKAIQLNPNDAAAYYNRGNAYGDKGNYDRAIENYNEAIQLKSDLVAAYYNRGNAYYQKGEYELAIGDFTKMIEIQPNAAGAYHNRGITRLHLQAWEEAKSDLTTARDMGMDIIASFQNDYESVSDFEGKHGIQLPPDIAAMLTPQ